MHKPWAENFEEFRRYIEEELGPRPSPQHSLDRIENEFGYAPGNLRWSDPKTQQRNKSNNRTTTINGEERCLQEWLEAYPRISRSTFYYKLKEHDGDAEKALLELLHTHYSMRKGDQT